MKSIAVVGTGLAGLAAAYWLSDTFDVSLITPPNKEKCASAIGVGILHAHFGFSANRHKEASTFLSQSTGLIRLAEKNSEIPLIKQIPLHRLPRDANQEKKFSKHKEWNGKELIIEESFIVDMPAYLKALEATCLKKGVERIEKKISHVQELLKYDAALLATGSGSHSLEIFKEQELIPMRGQLLLFNADATSHILSRKKYFFPSLDGKTTIVGGTFQEHNDSWKPKPPEAYDDLLPEIKALHPELLTKDYSCKAAVRLTRKERTPLYGNIHPGIWTLTALGSKGLFYHAELAHRVAKKIQEE